MGENAGQGLAYVFALSGDTWSQQAELTASDGINGNHFGYSVAVSGTTAVIGAPSKSDVDSFEQGAAYVFVQNGSTWTEQAELTSGDGAIDDNFGNSVALSGTTSVIGAYLKTVGGSSYQGTAYVFTANGSTWTQQQELTAADGAANDRFGYSVAVSGTTAVVGAYDHKVGSNSDQGAAYVFVQSGNSWSQQQELAGADGASGVFFGISVAVSGTTAVIDASDHRVESNTHQGAAYVFTQNGSTWTQQQELTASDGAAADYFGVSVAVSGSTAGIGAYFKKIPDTDSQGAAYAFERPPSTPFMISPTPGSMLTGPSATFTWTSVSGSEGYWLFLGTTGVGSDNLYDSHQQSATSATFSSLPTNGETIYARIYARYNGTMFFSDNTYTARMQPPVMTSPAPSSTLTDPSATFTWTAASPGNQGYWLFLGTKGVGSKDLFDSGQQTAMSVTFNGLPMNKRLMLRLGLV